MMGLIMHEVKKMLTPLLLLVSLVLVFYSCLASAVDWDIETDLDKYVNSFDPHYHWEEMSSYRGEGYTVHVINMTSQRWMDETVTLTPVWWHYLNIFVPDEPRIFDAAYFVISGGDHTNPPPSNEGNAARGEMRRTGEFCRKVGAVSALLTTVPFQPMRFTDTPNIPRTEDLIIARTWKRFIEDPNEIPDPNIVVLLPMTKAAKQGLDAVQEFMQEKYERYNIQKFMPTGFSKRGWTAWLLACVDKRIFALAPTVFDLLDAQRNMEHHYRALGGWSWAFSPYWVEDVSKYLYHPRVPDCEKLMDPFVFNERLTMPKLLIISSSDEFFPPDGSHYFWDRLTGPKLIQIMENDNHGMGEHLDERDNSLQSFFLTVHRGETLPNITWTRTETETSGTITVQTSPSVQSIAAWSADTTAATCEALRNGTCRRDFRQQALIGATGIMFHRSEVIQIGVDRYMVEFDKRTDFGYRIFFIEMKFGGPDNYQMRFTTEVNIIPDTFPYPKCETEEQCRGRLV